VPESPPPKRSAIEVPVDHWIGHADLTIKLDLGIASQRTLAMTLKFT